LGRAHGSGSGRPTRAGGETILSISEFLVVVAAFTVDPSVLFVAIAAAIKWIGGSQRGTAGAVRELHEEVELLRGEIETLRTSVAQTTLPPELDDIQSRLDFAERPLAQMKPGDALPGRAKRPGIRCIQAGPVPG